LVGPEADPGSLEFLFGVPLIEMVFLDPGAGRLEIDEPDAAGLTGRRLPLFHQRYLQRNAWIKPHPVVAALRIHRGADHHIVRESPFLAQAVAVPMVDLIPNSGVD